MKEQIFHTKLITDPQSMKQSSTCTISQSIYYKQLWENLVKSNGMSTNISNKHFKSEYTTWLSARDE